MFMQADMQNIQERVKKGERTLGVMEVIKDKINQEVKELKSANK